MSDCLFCKIVAGDIPSRKVYEDDDVLAFYDINPAAPVHFLVIPKLHVDSLVECDSVHQMLLGKLLLLAPKLAKEQGREKMRGQLPMAPAYVEILEGRAGVHSNILFPLRQTRAAPCTELAPVIWTDFRER